MKKETIVAFDFDGTITHSDTFLAFLRFTHSATRLVSGFLLLLPTLVLYKLGVIPNYKAKERVFRWFYRGWHIDRFDGKCKEFTQHIEKLVRPTARDLITRYRNDGAKVVVVSASIENWLHYWCINNGIDTVIGTKIEIDQQGYITGRFASKNCYGPEKVNRLSALYPARESYILEAYGDSRGDKELILFADRGYMNKI
ncbi:HAD-IB family hydrolase [Niastella caeni]|uniref:HAD-IB family hydrolase n=1 Tax=Niastella caeni TaxID=2569763 RepID=A0A4S8HXI2_9BACT|nr:HAD-IB family hydrolase [Niastella caeni]THU40350.1 HAD-IB family hydrolase [Niastella caeni]